MERIMEPNGGKKLALQNERGLYFWTETNFLQCHPLKEYGKSTNYYTIVT